jgi:glycosyltransferase involved in cell wall biosynthesis
MRILTLTTLYPNAAAPSHGVFVENRLRAFLGRWGAEARVVAPVPWFPVSSHWAGKYAAYARTPGAEVRKGIEVSHPRYAIPPKIGMTYAVHALERCFLRAASEIQKSGWNFDLIDAHYLYPDGVAAVRAARRLGKPVVVTARGADVNLLPRFPRQREMILEAVSAADGVICVAAALKQELIRLGAPPEKITVARNGVDLSLFRPLDRDPIRARLGLSGQVIASVGHLIERKGHHLVIEALAGLPGATLLIAGGGEEAPALRRLAHRLGVGPRVRFLGPVAHEDLAEIYNAADILALASSREGWPNVLLEAMACGTQAIASPVWGSVEVIAEPAAGHLAEARTAEAMSEALRRALENPPKREETRAFAEKYSWDETSDAAHRVYTAAIERRRAATAASCRPLVLKPANSGSRLIVTVDTEEIFDWARFEHAGHRIADPADIDRFQALAASFNVKPLYFLTYPVIADAASRDYFLALHRAGAADLGLHLHQWTTPPFDGFTHPYYSFQCNLPPDLHREKLRTLADAFEAAFGFRARAHRAGRYGISPADYEALASIGIDLDFSPSVSFDYSEQGGPDFSAMSNAPFAIDVGARLSVNVTPVSGMWALKRLKLLLPQSGPSGFRAAGPAWRLALSWPKRLSCEGATLSRLKSLTRRLAGDGVPVLTFSLHSTTMTPGATPYAADRAAVDANLALCADYLRFFRSAPGGSFLTVEELAALYKDQP